MNNKADFATEMRVAKGCDEWSSQANELEPSDEIGQFFSDIFAYHFPILIILYLKASYKWVARLISTIVMESPTKNVLIFKWLFKISQILPNSLKEYSYFYLFKGFSFCNCS